MRKYIKSYYILYVLFISATNINNQEILGFNYLVLKRDTIQKIPFCDSPTWKAAQLLKLTE